MKRKRYDEEFCKRVFHQFLCHFYRRDALRWEPVIQPQEPPDYYLRIAGQRYAVEVTTVMEQVSLGKWPGPLPGRSAPHRLIREVEAQAQRRQLLNGAYVVEMEPTADLNGDEDGLRRALLEYIARTREHVAAARVVVYRRNGCRWAIWKYAKYRNVIKPVTHVHDAWQRQVQGQLHELIEERVRTKAFKLHGVGQPKILLLFDQYHYGLDRSWAEASHTLDLTPFHTVARICDGGTTQVLSSVQPGWNGAAAVSA